MENATFDRRRTVIVISRNT